MTLNEIAEVLGHRNDTLSNIVWIGLSRIISDNDRKLIKTDIDAWSKANDELRVARHAFEVARLEAEEIQV